jgi:nucleotide-binding universal stress UspA family protein
MEEFAHPRIVVGVDGSLTSLAALRTAVAEARRRCVPLHAVRAARTIVDTVDVGMITTAFLDALGVIPDDIEIHQTATFLGVKDALCTSATDPRDLIVVGNSGKGAWHAFWSGSVSRSLLRRARCPILAVPAPEMARALRPPHRWGRPGRQDLWERIDTEVPELRGVKRIEG